MVFQGGIFNNYPEDIKLFHREKLINIYCIFLILFAQTGMSRHVLVRPWKRTKPGQKVPQNKLTNYWIFFEIFDGIYRYMPYWFIYYMLCLSLAGLSWPTAHSGWPPQLTYARSPYPNSLQILSFLPRLHHYIHAAYASYQVSIFIKDAMYTDNVILRLSGICGVVHREKNYTVLNYVPQILPQFQYHSILRRLMKI